MTGSTHDESATSSPELRRILVAEDEHLVAVDLAQHIKGLGYELIGPVSNGEQAIEIARAEQPDLALLDVRMPGMDGLGAARVIFGQMNIPVVILSAFSDPDYIRASADIGVFGYMLKPVTIDDMRVSLTVAWSRFREQQGLTGRVHELETALEDRKDIERAKGLLMDRLNLSEQDAMRRLRKQARDSRRKLADLARAILETKDLLG